MNVEELCCYLQEELQGIDDVLDNIRKHKIDGQIFLQLNEEYLREVAPLLGDRIKLKMLITKARDPLSVSVTPESNHQNFDDVSINSSDYKVSHFYNQ